MLMDTKLLFALEKFAQRAGLEKPGALVLACRCAGGEG